MLKINPSPALPFSKGGGPRFAIHTNCAGSKKGVIPPLKKGARGIFVLVNYVQPHPYDCGEKKASNAGFQKLTNY